uniref:PDZ domain-containing protein n=1 Tax=Ascaris lumbricoides TaxID=6252 RepID=A0A9J2P1T3_ASCLU
MDEVEEKWKESSRAVNIEPGYGPDFPRGLLRKKEFQFECEAGKIPMIKLTRSMLVVSVKETALEKFDLGDWVFAVNDLKFIIYRTIKTMKITNINASPFIPQATETQNGYAYLVGYITMYPGSSLGINIKSYNYKVYVTSTDNGFQSLGMRTLLVGDAILAVNGQPQTTVAGASALIIQSLTKNKYVCIVIERAESEAAIRQVRMALLAEKTQQIDPRMPDDVIDICRAEIERMSQGNEVPPAPIYKRANSTQQCIRNVKKTGKGAVKVAEGSLETAIGMDPINPVLLQHVPPLPGPRANVPVISPEPSSTSPTKQTAQSKVRRISFSRKRQYRASHSQ